MMYYIYMKICCLNHSNGTEIGTEAINLYAGSLYFYLRSFLDTVYPDNPVEWVDKIFTFDDYDQVIDRIISSEPEFVLLSYHVWDSMHIDKIARGIREKNQQIRFIGGGPSMDIKNKKSNFDNYPYLEAIFYGDGEEAFYEFIKRYEETGEISDGINCATPHGDGYYKRFRFEEWEPYLTFTQPQLIDDFVKANAELKEKFGCNPQWMTETNRGCPYNCTFCDWNSGLHNKMSFKKLEIIKEEVSNFANSPARDHMVLRTNDANFGQVKRDEEILDHYISNDLPIRISSWSKLQKVRTYQLMSKYNDYLDYTYKRIGLKAAKSSNISLQCINKKSLEAIDRPEVDWHIHKDMIKEFAVSREYGHSYLVADLILDIPYMGYYEYIYQFCELYSAGFENLGFQPWELLPNAPANNLEYQQKYNLEIKPTLWIETVIPEVNSIREIDSKLRWENSYSTDIIMEIGGESKRIFAYVIHSMYNTNPHMMKKLKYNLGKIFALSESIKKIIKKQEAIYGKQIWGIYQPKIKTAFPMRGYLQEFMTKNPASRIKQENWNIPDLDKIMDLLDERFPDKIAINQ